jgi:hypothetical protein
LLLVVRTSPALLDLHPPLQAPEVQQQQQQQREVQFSKAADEEACTAKQQSHHLPSDISQDANHCLLLSKALSVAPLQLHSISTTCATHAYA